MLSIDITWQAQTDECKIVYWLLIYCSTYMPPFNTSIVHLLYKAHASRTFKYSRFTGMLANYFSK